METNNIVTFCGSITKKESLIPIESNIVENSWVAEANFPYANYYGQVPAKPKPNSLFLFTERFYSLEEVLWFSDELYLCFTNKIDVASAVIEFQNKQYPAIRIKNFPDYEQLQNFQKCLAQQGVIFTKKTPFVTEIKAVINKCFELKKLDEGIYLDMIEDNKGYITTQKKIDRRNFEKLISKIRNNSNCPLYDAVPGGFIINSHSVDFIRIFSEKIDINLLNCIKKELPKFNL